MGIKERAKKWGVRIVCPGCDATYRQKPGEPRLRDKRSPCCFARMRPLAWTLDPTHLQQWLTEKRQIRMTLMLLPTLVREHNAPGFDPDA